MGLRGAGLWPRPSRNGSEREGKEGWRGSSEGSKREGVPHQTQIQDPACEFRRTITVSPEIQYVTIHKEMNSIDRNKTRDLTWLSEGRGGRTNIPPAKDCDPL